jgi:DNA-binding LacI/PurR family transcriptional regulator
MAGRDYFLAGQGQSAAVVLTQPRLTTTSYCGEEIGRRPFNLFMERLAKTRHDGPQRILVTPRLIEGETTRA